MYQDPIMRESIRKVEAAREANMKLDPRRMTAEEKENLLRTITPTTAMTSLPIWFSAPTRDKRCPGNWHPCSRESPVSAVWRSNWTIQTMMWMF